MNATSTATVHDVETLIRILAVRGLLDAFATGMLLPTTASLANLAGVLAWASRHQWAADLEREVAA